MDASGVRQPVKASALLSYDEFGNLTIDGEILDERLDKAVLLDFTGRIVIDPGERVFYAANVEAGQKVDSNRLAPVGLDKVRQYAITDDRSS